MQKVCVCVPYMRTVIINKVVQEENTQTEKAQEITHLCYLV